VPPTETEQEEKHLVAAGSVETVLVENTREANGCDIDGMLGQNPVLTKFMLYLARSFKGVIVEYGALMEAAQPEDRKSVPNTKSYMPEKWQREW